MDTQIETTEVTEKTVPSVDKVINEDGLFDRLLERVKAALPDFLKPQPDSVFSVQKDLNGKWRWVAAFTNNFKDRDGEIISEKALDGYLERVNMGLVPMPELWIGHVVESKHGQADMVFGAGNYVVAVGHYDDTELGELALKYDLKHAAKTPLSHGFTFPSWGLKNGIYEVANPFEITKLPPPLIPSNPFTDFEVGNMKQITPEQKAALALVFGQEKAETIVKTREAQSEEIKAAGVAFKDFAEVTEEKPVEGEKPDTQKPMADLLAELIESQGELLSLLTAEGKALIAEKTARISEKEATDKRIAELETTVKELRAELKLSPRASEAAETKLTDEAAAALKAEMAKANPDTFWNA